MKNGSPLQYIESESGITGCWLANHCMAARTLALVNICLGGIAMDVQRNVAGYQPKTADARNYKNDWCSDPKDYFFNNEQ